MGKEQLPRIDDNRPKLTLNPALANELTSRTSRKSLVTGGNEMLPNEIKQFTGGVDLGRVKETLGGNVNIFHGDVQDRLGEKQSGADKIGNFAVQVGAEILGGTLEGIGYLGDVQGTSALLDGDMHSFGNWLSDIGTGLKEGSRENFPIFGAHDMGNLGFWLSNGVSVASSLSLMIPAVGAVRGVSALSKAMGIAQKFNQPTRAFMSTLGQSFASRHMENNMEAAGAFSETRDAAIAAGKSINEANLSASEAARNLYLTNYALMAQDFFQYRLLARGPKINADISSRRLAKALGVNPAGVTTKGMYEFGKDMASEGLEEGLQFVFAEEAKYHSLSKAGIIKEEELGERLKKYGENSELWTNMLFGGLGAGVMQGVGSAGRGLGITGKAEKEALEARIKHAKEAHETSTSAAVKLQAAMKSGDQSAILEAENEMVFNIAYNAAQVGNFDLAMATIDDLIDSDPAEATAEGSDFAPDYKQKLKKVKKDMQKVGKLFAKNARKYSSDTTREITQLQYNNFRWNRQLPETKAAEARQKAEYPLHGNLSSQGQELFEAHAEKLGLERAVRVQKNIVKNNKKGTMLHERASARVKKFESELKRVDNVVKSLEKKEEQAIALDKGDPNDENSSYQTSLTNNKERVEKDRKILEGLKENTDDLQRLISERIHLETAIQENNEDLKTITSNKGQTAAQEVFNKLREEKKRIEKEALKAEKQRKKDEQNKKDDDSVANSVDNDNKNKEEENNKTKKGAGEESNLAGEENTRKSTAESFTDKELDEKIASTNNPKVKEFLQKEKDKREEKKEAEKKKVADSKVTKGNQLIDSIETDQIETPDNSEQKEQQDPNINESSQVEELVAKSGSAIAWKTTTGLGIVELAEQVSKAQKENAIALSNFLEDPNVDKTQYKLEFYIDKETLKGALDSKEGVDDTLKKLYEKLTAYKNGKGPSLTAEEIGVLPVRAYIVNNKGERVTYSGGKSLTTAVHDTTFERWNQLDPIDQQAAINEVIATKEKILDAAMKGKTATADITSVRNGHLMTTKTKDGKFAKNNVSMATGIAPENITIVMGDSAAKGETSRYITQEKEKTEEYDDLVGYSSATPGAIYVVVKTANGSSFPLRTFIEDVTQEEGELIYNLYAKTFENKNAYKENLAKHPDILNFIKNSDNPRVAGLVSFLNLEKITMQDLLKVLVYEGQQTKSSGPGALFSTPNNIKVGGVNISKDLFLKESGKKVFIETVMKKRRQVSISLLNNPDYVSYLINNEVITTNATNVNGVMFRHPTTEFGEVEVGTPSKKAEPEAASVPVAQPTVVEVKVNSMTVVYDTETGAMTFKGSQKEVTSETVKNKALVKYERDQGTIRTVTYNGTEYKILSDDRIISMAKSNPGVERHKSGKGRETILAQAGAVPGTVTPTSTEQDTSQLTDEDIQLMAEMETEKFLADEKTESLSIDDIINQEKTTEAEKEILNFIKRFWGGKIMYQKEYNFDVPLPNAQGGFDTGSWGGTFDARTNSVLIFGEQNLDAEFVIHEAMHGLLATKLEEFQGEGLEADFDPVFSAEVNRLYEIAKAALPADKYYGLTNPHEFLSEAFGDPEFRKILGGLPDPKADTNLLTSFIEAIRKFFSDNGMNIENSVLDSILATTTRTLDPASATTDTTTEDGLWDTFVDTGIIPQSKVQDIANKIMEGKSLTDRELSMREAYAKDIENILNKGITTDTATAENPGKVLVEQIIADVNDKGLRVQLDPNGDETNYYIDDQGNVYLRATARVNPMEPGAKEKPLVKSSLEIGTKVDNIIRDFFDEDSVLNQVEDIKNIDPRLLYKYDIGGIEMVQEFIDSLQSLKDHFAKTGETVVSKGLLLHSEDLGLAGTVDLLTYDKKGNIRIYDVKSMRGNKLINKYASDNLPKYDSTMWAKKSDRQKHIDQLSTYALILKDKYGVETVQLGILPIEVFYKNDGIVHTETEKLERVYDNGAPFIDVKNDPSVLERTAAAYDNSDGTGYSKEEDLAVDPDLAGEDVPAATDGLNIDGFDLGVDDVKTGTEVNLEGVNLTNTNTAEGVKAEDTGENLGSNQVINPSDDIMKQLGLDSKPSRQIKPGILPKPARPTTGAITPAEIAEVQEMVPESIATSVIEDYVTLLDGGQAVVGAFQEGLIQISRRAKTGDGYHEAFHAVFRTMLGKNKQEELLQEARDMFMPLDSDIEALQIRHKISKERATNLYYEEQLADEFGIYAANPRAYDFNKKKKRENYFNRLLSWIKDILGVTGNMEKIFKNLKQGNFKSMTNINLLVESGVVEQICKGY